MVESAPNAMILVDKEGMIVFANSETERLFGFNENELLNQPIEILIPGRFSEKHPGYRNMFFTTPSTRSMGAGRDLFAKRRDGSEFPVEIGLNPIDTPDGYFVLAAVIDITERKKFEVQLSLFASIINSSDDAIISKTTDGIITSWNHGAEKVFGYEAGEIIGKSIGLLVPADRLIEEKEISEKIARGEEVSHYETDRIRKDGTINVMLTISPIKDAAGNIIGASKISRDITERKVYERNKLKSEFLANISHELRTPMNAIIGFSELLIDKKVGDLNAKQLDYLNDIHASGSHLLQLINDVLDLARIEAGKVHLTIETFSIQNAIEEVIKVINPLAQKKRIIISLNLYDRVDMVSLDKNKFRQILYNLISNAIKFNATGGTIYIETGIRPNNAFYLKVTDTGIGIAKENTRKLFIPFVQLDSGTTRRHEGTGLGLALTKNIVELQKGVISVESTLGTGSTFTVVLPLKLEVN